MARKFNYERAACALTDALVMGDEAAARRWNISVRSIEVWRVRLSSDPILVEFYNRQSALKTADWVNELPKAIAAGIDFLNRAFKESDHRDPEVQTALASGLKILADIDTTRKIIDVQLQQLQQSQSSITPEGAVIDEGIAESTIDTTAEEIE